MSGTHAGVSTTPRAWYVRASMRARPAADKTAFGAGLGLSQGLTMLLGLGACGPQGDPRPQPTIVLANCGAGVAELECGSLEVEENRDAPNGRTLQLSIIVAR